MKSAPAITTPFLASEKERAVVTYDVKNEEGHVVAFEIENVLIGRRGTERVIERIPGVRILRRYKLFSGADQFCEFELDGVQFAVYEPYGNNSRYWIGPKTPAFTPQLLRVRDAFAVHSTHTTALRIGLGLVLVALWFAYNSLK